VSQPDNRRRRHEDSLALSPANQLPHPRCCRLTLTASGGCRFPVRRSTGGGPESKGVLCS
jgi:hypothetical protein